jgi:glycosyltransferase involved in cell wall biosynthesis
MRVTQIVASVDNPAAGTVYVVKRLAAALARGGVIVDILCTGHASGTYRGDVVCRAFAPSAPGMPLIAKLAISRDLGLAIDRAAADGHVLHSHGLWLMPNVYPAWAARRHRAPHVLSPHGMLGPAALRFSRRKKRLMWWLAQRDAVESATCLHATSHQECHELRAFGLKAPIAVIPNGIDLPSEAKVAAGKARRARSTRTLLHLGRIHPKKGIDRLIEAWALLEPQAPDWQLRVVGPSEGGHREALAARAAALGIARVSFEDGVFGAEKDAAYQEADLFVLPTLNENFGLVVAEALANGTPAICTKGAPWEGLELHGCGWWIDHGVAPLAAALAEAIARPAAVLDQMGARARAWMAADFSWSKAAADMERVYRWCLKGGDPPDVVETRP